MVELDDRQHRVRSGAAAVGRRGQRWVVTVGLEHVGCADRTMGGGARPRRCDGGAGAMLHDAAGAGAGVTNRRRLFSLIVIALIPFVARWVQAEFRAPAGTTERVLPYLLLSVLCVAIVAIMESPPRTSSVTR